MILYIQKTFMNLQFIVIHLITHLMIQKIIHLIIHLIISMLEEKIAEVEQLEDGN